MDPYATPTCQPLAGYDPRYDQLEFSFKEGCPSDLDCQPESACPPPVVTEPEINYLAKDYASFRQLILDRLALTIPGWQEQHVSDMGIALVEILAYAADYLSYYQDAVATEAYLGTARQRISVRRHVRLVDYPMHEGCNARTWVRVDTNQDVVAPPLDAANVYFLSGSNVDLNNLDNSGEAIFSSVGTKPISLYKAHSLIHFYTFGNQLCCLPKGSTAATLLDQVLPDEERPAAEGKPKRKEPANSYQKNVEQPMPAPFSEPRILHLQAGDILILEEVLGPGTGNAADADPTHRHAVQLTKVRPLVDPLYGAQVLEIEWAADDALPFDLCLSVLGPPPSCELVVDVSVARGNVLLVDNGFRIADERLGQVPAGETLETCKGIHHALERFVQAGGFRPTLQRTGLTFSQRFSPGDSAATALLQDPRQAMPAIQMTSIPPLPDGSGPLFDFSDLHDQRSLALRLGKVHVPSQEHDDGAIFLRGQLSAKLRHLLDQFAASTPPQQLSQDLAKGLLAELQQLLRHWTPQPDLLESNPGDRHYVVEMDDDGYAHLRFGEGDLGCAPEAGESFSASYRVGNGAAGNVGSESITQLVLLHETLNGSSLQPENPMAAQGGTNPEPMDEVKMFAPGAFRKQLERAITADDYARLAETNPKVQRAAGTLRWTGSGYEVRVAIDPLGTDQADPSLLGQIEGHLYSYRRIGHDLVVVAAQYVPLNIAMTICVLPDYLQGHVEAALIELFSAQVLAGGERGFFHPDNLTFGTAIYLSQLVAAAQAVIGVESVVVSRLERFFEGPNGELESGFLPIGPLELAQLDNAPGFPEHGVLSLDLRGGR